MAETVSRPRRVGPRDRADPLRPRQRVVQPLGDGRFAGRGPRMVDRGGRTVATSPRSFCTVPHDGGRRHHRHPRSLTIPYLAPPAEGDVVMETIKRAGRQVAGWSPGGFWKATAFSPWRWLHFRGEHPARHHDAQRSAHRPNGADPADAEAGRATRRRSASATSSGGQSAIRPSPAAARKRSSAAGSASLNRVRSTAFPSPRMPTRGSRRSSHGFPSRPRIRRSI